MRTEGPLPPLSTSTPCRGDPACLGVLRPPALGGLAGPSLSPAPTDPQLWPLHLDLGEGVGETGPRPPGRSYFSSPDGVCLSYIPRQVGHLWTRQEERGGAGRKCRRLSHSIGASPTYLGSRAGCAGSMARTQVRGLLPGCPVLPLEHQPQPGFSPQAQRQSCSPKAGPRVARRSALLPGWSPRKEHPVARRHEPRLRPSLRSRDWTQEGSRSPAPSPAPTPNSPTRGSCPSSAPSGPWHGCHHLHHLPSGSFLPIST